MGELIKEVTINKVFIGHIGSLIKNLCTHVEIGDTRVVQYAQTNEIEDFIKNEDDMGDIFKTIEVEQIKLMKINNGVWQIMSGQKIEGFIKLKYQYSYISFNAFIKTEDKALDELFYSIENYQENRVLDIKKYCLI